MYKCLICGQIFDESYDICPICGVGKENFIVIKDDNKNTTTDKKITVAIVGAGIAGVQTAFEIRKKNKFAKIYLISNEKILPYNRTLLTKDLQSDLINIEIYDYEKYETNNINLFLGKEVVNINKEYKEVTLNDNTVINYDILVIASGSKSLVLNSGNFNRERIFSIRSINDVKNLKKACISQHNVTIIGAGVLGLELACQLKKLNMNVTLLEKKKQILVPEMDVQSSIYLKELLTKNNIKYFEDDSVREFKEDSLILNSNQEIMTDILVYSIGIIPNIEIAKNIGLKTNRGILVNEYLEAEKDIYVAGDVCEFDGKIVGLWNNALDMANVVSQNILENKQKFERDLYPLAFHLFDNDFYVLGKITDDLLEKNNESENKFCKYFFENDLLVGCVLINRRDLVVKTFNDIKNKNINKMNYN